MMNEIRRMQQLAGIKLNELDLNDPNDLSDIGTKLGEIGISFDEGLLGGVGSGGAGYYDYISDIISGFDLDKFNLNKFNKWYDNFNINSFNSLEVKIEEFDDNGWDVDLYKEIKPGYYNINNGDTNDIDNGPQLANYLVDYSKTHDMGCIKIENDGYTLYAYPTLSHEDGNEFLNIFKLNKSGNVIPALKKQEVIDKLRENLTEPGTWSII